MLMMVFKKTILLLSMNLAVTGGQGISQRSDEVATIQPLVHTHLGEWGAKDYCPEGTYVYDIRIKFQKKQYSKDDTALNRILLYCK